MSTSILHHNIVLHDIIDIVPDVCDSGFPENYNRPLIWLQIRQREDVYSQVKSKGYVATNEVEKRLLSVWRSMMNRCYDKSHKSFKSYGGKGIFVHYTWRDAKNFIRDSQYLPNWPNKEADWENYQLDKDYFGSNCYSPSTCMWLHFSENAIYREVTRPIHIDGTLYLNVTHASKALGIGIVKIKNLISGNIVMRGTLRNSTAAYVRCDNYVLRQALVKKLPKPEILIEIVERINTVL